MLVLLVGYSDVVCHSDQRRCSVTGLSVGSPLKAALTGLELVLARAQIWEESAAKHVSLGQELVAVAALATRWRKLELAAWRNLLNTTRHRHAAGLVTAYSLAGSMLTLSFACHAAGTECALLLRA